MKQSRIARGRHAAAATVLLLASAGALDAAPGKSGPVAQPAAPAAAPAANAPPTAGQVAMRRGVEAYKKGDLANAVGSLSSAVSSGGLNGQDLARSLYFRGLAYRKQGKPAQAISDLTNAIWLKDGLSTEEHADAVSSRSTAYREAGLAEPGGAVTAPIAAAAAAAATSAPPPEARATTSPAAAAQRPVASPGYWQTASSAPAPAQAALTAPAAQPASSGGGFGDFLGSIFGGFGGSSSQSPSSSGDVTTASTAAPAAAAAPAAISSWASSTEAQAARAPAQRNVKVADARPAPAAKPAVAAPSGKFKLQVAVLRSRDEAERVAETLLIKHAPKLGQRTTMVEETVLGNMGTFYRVNVMPFADAAEPERLCGVLRGDGYDCLVVK